MKHTSYIYMIICLVSALLVCSLPAQTAKESIFGDIEEQIAAAKEQGAEWLSPENYAKAVENFRKANEYYLKNESTRDIREKLTEAQKYCTLAMEAVNLGKISLGEAIKARGDAIRAEAQNFSSELFNEAEQKFADAAGEVEDGDLEDARKKGSEAEKFYRQAELKAIKDKLLGDARRLVTEAETEKAMEFAPATYTRAVDLLNRVEELLVSDRYATDQAMELASESEYQARHSMYLTSQIKDLSQEETNWEKLILQFEDVLTKLANQLDESPTYEIGMKDAIALITTRVTNLKNEHQALLAENAQLQEEYNAAQEIATTSSAELAKKRAREEKIQKTKDLFTPEEAKVIYDSENLIIHLHGLNFPPGQAIIQPEFFSLLTKVQNAIKIFPDKHILLEGHTDSRGVAQKNKRLSEDRSVAVREYLIANMGKSREQITAIGYGSAKPISTNLTTEGRALNRRIDIVININE